MRVKGFSMIKTFGRIASVLALLNFVNICIILHRMGLNLQKAKVGFFPLTCVKVHFGPKIKFYRFLLGFVFFPPLNFSEVRIFFRGIWLRAAAKAYFDQKLVHC